MAEHITDEVAESDIITMKMAVAETEEVVKSVDHFRDFLGGYSTHPKRFKNMVLNG